MKILFKDNVTIKYINDICIISKGTNQFENSDSNSKYYNFLKLKEWEKTRLIHMMNH